MYDNNLWKSESEKDKKVLLVSKIVLDVLNLKGVIYKIGLVLIKL